MKRTRAKVGNQLLKPEVASFHRRSLNRILDSNHGTPQDSRGWGRRAFGVICWCNRKRPISLRKSAIVLVAPEVGLEPTTHGLTVR